MFTITDLQEEIKKSQYTCRIQCGEYKLSIGFSCNHYCSPRKKTHNGEYESVELALFKNGNWVIRFDMKNIFEFKWADLWEDEEKFSIAPYVPIKTVCDIINHMRTIQAPAQKQVNEFKNKGRCRRCGSYDPYINDGDLCWNCCG